MRLPIPPPPQGLIWSNFDQIETLNNSIELCRPYFLAGAGGGVPGVIPIAGFGAFFVFKSREVVPPALRVAKIDNDMEVSMKTIAEIVVAFDKRVADPLGPNAV